MATTREDMMMLNRDNNTFTVGDLAPVDSTKVTRRGLEPETTRRDVNSGVSSMMTIMAAP